MNGYTKCGFSVQWKYSAIKRNEVLITCYSIENIILNEISQTQKVTYYMIPLYDMSRIGKSIERESRLGAARG